MGNICSSSQKTSKDADSEKSEGGGSEYEYKFPAKEKSEEKDLGDKAANMNSMPVANDTNAKSDTLNEITHHPNCDEIEKINKLNACSAIKISPIFRKLPEHDKKIVLSVIITNKKKYKQQMGIINRILPDLSKHARAKGFELIVSLTHHHQTTSNETSQSEYNEDPLCDHEELENYFNEIARHKNAYIIPVLFFAPCSEKLACPMEIEQKDFSFLLSITSKEQSDLLKKYYTAAADSPNEPSAVYSLSSHSSLQQGEIEEILETFITLMPLSLKSTYLLTAAEKIVNNVLSSKELIKHCIWIQDNEDKSVASDASSSSIMTEVSSKHLNLNCQLKDEIPLKNVIPPLSSDDEGEELYELFREILKSNIDSVIHEHLVKYNSRNTLGMCKIVSSDIEATKRHTIAMGGNNVSSFDTEAILKYIRSDSLYPLAVFGKPEDRISHFTSQLALNIENTIEDFQLVVRYARFSVISSEITSLLASIADQISIIVAGKPCHSQHNIQSYKSTIERLLESCSFGIIILIDSVEQIIGATDFDWLPKISKSNAKIILTITTAESLIENQTAKELTKRGIPKENLLPILLNKKNDNSEVEAKLLSLGVKMYNNATEKSIDMFLVTLQSKIDVKFLEILLVIIAISPYGIYETDCIGIFEEEAKIDRVCALIVWSKFCWLLGPWLIHTNYIKMADDIFEAAVLKKYSKTIQQIRNAAKRYFENQEDSFFDSDKNSTSLNSEKFLKVPQYDLAILFGKDENNPEQYFTQHFFKDLSWISNKITSCGGFQYLFDIVKAEEQFKKSSNGFPHVTLLKQFSIQHMMQLNYDGSQFYTLFKIFLKDAMTKDESLNSNDAVQNWTATINQLKIIHLEKLVNDDDDANEENDNQENTTEGEVTKTYNEVVILKEPGHFVAAISTDCDEICVWDVLNCKRIRVLKCVPKPSLLCSIRNFEAAVLCKREIKVIDLEEGLYRATMKGVMNQKMPYFGLHDEDHLVCLSRNRMYVNLMNLKTGDCATSFKAGEDRFLNSLIVSGNGRILVCGDESQKPFSLLVWHLSQRRLLYDLRIPHHDLFTALSAITYEGLYVSVVAKEIKEPGPNFIVVYDLQSGTLFQKLKPTCNTVAIAISQANGCVIAGLENAEILIWDLVTGNCRHTLIGHNSPATMMKLDPLGRCLLSGDKDGRDLSLRLWELSTGKSLAVYTPPQKISSCEILDNGAYIIIATEETPGILILQLKNYDETKTQSENFAHKILECKIHTLKED